MTDAPNQTPISQAADCDVCSKEPTIGANYDSEADVLYVYKEKPAPALTDEDEDGLLLRYSIDDNQPVGVTVPSFHEAWRSDLDFLSERISNFLGVSQARAKEAITAHCEPSQ